MIPPVNHQAPISTAHAVNASNRYGWDYEAAAAAFTRLPYPIIDVHSHINGGEAASIYARAARLYGIGLTYSMTHLDQVDSVRAVLGDRIRFIAVPDYMSKDRRHAMGAGFLERIEQYHALGSRIVKFWNAPRAIDTAREFGFTDYAQLDAPHRIDAMNLASGLGMIFMTHVGDPDTWFATKYADASIYGTKASHYVALERLLDRFTQPWIAAHLGGWPENLDFLIGLLERHPNLFLDASATKWIVREVSGHPRNEITEFLARFSERVMFGSDIVTSDEHLVIKQDKNEMTSKASTRNEAFDLYASRYWALRTLWETGWAGESPIADPDLKLVDPARHGEMDAPLLEGKSLPPDLLRTFYHDAADALLEPLNSRS
jgi:hypothetical protein